MKKILVTLSLIVCAIQNIDAQKNSIRPAALGISFFFDDFVTPDRIRSTTLSKVMRDHDWAKFNEMSPGVGLSYFKGLWKNIDFAGNMNLSFPSITLPGKTTSSSDAMLLEADASGNFKLFSDDYWVTPYAIAGIGASKYKNYYGAFVPLGVGFKVNLFDEAAFFINSTYRVPVTPETITHHFVHSFGVAGVIGNKKQPEVKPLPPPPIPLDTDKDGVVDSLDKCPTVAGLAKYQGCPVPDTDKDGINDEEDKCPTVAGLAKYQGCPIPDTDGDGINDEEDKCPTVAGLARYQGCPIPDTDGDGVNDEEDKCPTEKGLPENAGCPTLEQFKFDARKVQFVTGSATLTKVAKTELDKAITVLNEHPTIKLAVDGHTDNTGKEATNQKLSEKRAEAVKAYFIKKGISADRLSAAGYGQTMPIADNKTAAGRSANRRVEFKLAE